ncbi:uncharacterized protein BDFB_003544 [Asbolus verrucosus]|uniref:Uncharacterized protein n=1 Tax=Asbolus verrucosus TaxID=1661398 RepID=A0A482VB74_ASBVE|nr:uncharacterized protein BDFB_003544 [Asbolus verrucosus]
MSEKALKYIERLPNNFDIGNGIRVKQTDAARLSRKHTPITLPNETTAREATLNRVLLERITEYFRSHTLEFKMPLAAVKDMQMPMEEGRGKGEGGGGGGYGGGGGGGGGKGGKGGKKGSMMPLLMMFHFKAATMGAMAIKLIGMVAFKALLAAKIALTIALAVAAKKLFEQKHHTQTYEVVAHPQVVHDDYGHHDRSYVQDLAYRAHRNGS